MLARLVSLLMCLCAATSCACAAVLQDLARAKDYTSGRVSSSDPSGGNADGRQDIPLKPGQKRVLADLKGPGSITHIWITLAPMDADVLSNLILRAYWDEEKSPSVEVPIGEFFGLGHGRTYSFDSLPIAVGNDRGLNCFFPMPFRKRALIVAENAGRTTVGAFYYYVDYHRFRKPQADLLSFHAQYRQEKPAVSAGNYTIMEAKGRGHYVGCFLYVRSNDGGWWGEGDDMIYIDGAKEPQLAGTGTEDYFCHAWGMREGQAGLRFGAPLYEVHKTAIGNKNTMYRFHIEDAVAFNKDIRVTMEHGHANDRYDDFSSVAYWYQTEPHSPFPRLPKPQERMASEDRLQQLLDAKDYAGYRAAQTEILERAGSPHLRLKALYHIGESYLLEGDTEKAIAKFKTVCEPIPDAEWGAKAIGKLKELGVAPNDMPKSNTYAVSGIHDGKLIKTKIDGKLVLRTDAKNGSPYIYFKAPPGLDLAGDTPVLVEVEYYNFGKAGDSFRLEYDSDMPESQEANPRYHPTPAFEKPAEPGWRFAILMLEKPKLAGGQHAGADFRINCLKDGDEYISSVRVLAGQK